MDRFRSFSIEELHELNSGLGRSKYNNALAGRLECALVCEKMLDEIRDEQIQRKHREARLRVPA